MAGTINTTTANSTPQTIGIPTDAPSPLDNNTPSPLSQGTLNVKPVPTPVAPHPSTPSPATTPQATPVANKSVTLPNGAVVQVNDKGDIVSGDSTNGGKGILPGSDASHAADAYAANQSDKTNSSAADDLGNKLGSSGTSSFISTSDSVQNNEDATTKALQDLTANNPAAIQAHQDTLDELEKERTALEDRRQQEMDQIDKDFEGQKAAMEKTQASETGVENILQQRAGGYLGMGASQTGALISLSQNHTDELNSLEAKRQSAIQTAQNAIDDKEFSLAQAKVKEASDYAAAQAAAKQKYFEDVIQVHKQEQDNVTFAQDQAQKSLTALASLSEDQVKTLDPASLKKIDDAYGVPGFAQSYIDTQRAINGAKSQTDAIDAQQKLYNLADTLPKGKTITFPDPSNPGGPGLTITGQGKAGDISTFTATDDQGRITMFTYDKGSNTVTRQSLGGGGKTKTTGAGDTDTSLKSFGKSIDALRVPVDPANPALGSYITANQYVAARKAYVDANPGKGGTFDTQFPVEQTVIPSQGTLVSKLISENAKAK